MFSHVEHRETVDFTICDGADIRSAVRKVAMYLPNPEDDWGPKARAGRKRYESWTEPHAFSFLRKFIYFPTPCYRRLQVVYFIWLKSAHSVTLNDIE